MKCSTCNKEIPETSQVCPFCYTAIKRDPLTFTSDAGNIATINTTFQSTDNNELNFGDLSQNTSFDENNSLKTYFQEPKEKKKIMIPILIVFGIFILLFIILSVFREHKADSYLYYTGVVDRVYEYIDANLTSPNNKYSGTYKFIFDHNTDDTREFRGTYQYDIPKKLFDITADLKDTNIPEGGVIVGDKTFTMELFGKNNELYLTSKNLFENTILLPYEDETGFLTTKQYDLESIMTGIHDATNYALKHMEYEDYEDVSYKYFDTEMVTDKKVLKLDYKNKGRFISLFLTALLDDNNFISEYSKVSDKKMSDVEKMLNNYKSTYEYQYSMDDGKVTYINIYYKKDKVYRIEVDMTKENNDLYTLDLENNKYYFRRYSNDEIVTSMDVIIVETTMNDVLTRTYNIGLSLGGDIYTFKLELNKENLTQVKSKEFEKYKSIRDFTEEDTDKLKDNIKVYMENADFVDNIKDVFKTKCTKDLSCVCNSPDEDCSCTYQDKIITCPRESVSVDKKQEE